MRRGSLIQLAAIGLVAAGIATAVALLVPWLPVVAGKEARRIHLVIWFATAIAIGIFSIVASVLTYSIWKFRADPDDWSDGPPIHGHTRLEIVWTAVPALLVTSIAIVSAIVLAQNGRAGSDPLIVKVTAQQFAWEFTYPNGKAYGYLTLQKDRPTKLEITSKDVVHAFWVPQLAQQEDAVPGEVTSIVVTPTRTGTFPVICTMLCGLGHSVMRSHVDILTAAKFTAWTKSGSSAASSPAGLAVFQQNGCGSCHTLASAGANGKIGPDLDKLAQYAKQANRGTLAQFVHESIVTPSAYVQPGYPDAMPKIFGTQIPPAQLNQLVQYLVMEANKK